MTLHLFGAVLTPEGVAANNRGENEGNTTTLQKLLRRGEIISTVSAEAIRFAIRESWTAAGQSVNRSVNANGESRWNDTSFEQWKEHIDDDVMGFMDPKKETLKRRGRLEISRALSTRPWLGDVMFNASSPGAHPRGNADPIPYAVEVHYTRYQYNFGLAPTTLGNPAHTLATLDALQNLARVAGNHARYLYQFAPEAIILRWTHDPAPRMLYCFEEDEDGKVGVDKLVRAVRSGDISPEELVVGGDPLLHLQSMFEDLGVPFHAGVRRAFEDIRTRVAAVL